MSRRRSRALPATTVGSVIALATVVLAGSCTSSNEVLQTSIGGAGPSDGEVSALVFDPPLRQLVLDGVSTGTATFRLKATFVSGATREVTAQFLQFDRPDLAALTPGATVTLTAQGTFAGAGHLQAVYLGMVAMAELDVVIHQRDLGSVGADVAAALDATTLPPTDTAVTSLLYPYDETVFPLGLSAPLLMWDLPAGAAANASDVYRLHLQEGSYTYDVYSTMKAPAQWPIGQAVWDRVTASNSGATDPLQVVLSRWDASTKKASTSVAVSWTIAHTSLRGAIYYWSASGSGGTRKGHITRIRPGSGAAPQTLNEGKCTGCHAVSADGSTLVASVDDPSTPTAAPYSLNWNPSRAWASFDISQPDAPLIYQSTQYSADLALTPDGKYTIWGQPTTAPSTGDPVPGSRWVSLSNTATGELVVDSGLDAITGIAAKDMLTMPAFSPDGKKVAFVVGPNGGDGVLPKDPRAIAYLSFHANTLHFDPVLTPIVQASDLAFASSRRGLGYPSFTPDSSYIGFHAGTNTTGCYEDPCDDTVLDDGELFLASAAGGAPIRLTALDDPPASHDRGVSIEPTFCPEARGGYSWMVFTSMRDWGNKLTGPATPGPRPNGLRRLWVAAIDEKIGAVDPSHPAFYIGEQEDRPNMRGFWALASCTPTPKVGDAGGACKAGFECCSGFCSLGACVDVSTLACAAVGATCARTADCCNGSGGGVECVAHECTVVPPPK